MEHALRTLPKGLGAYNEAYQEAMERIRGQKQGFQDLAIRTLSWITCAEQPLTTLELQHALAVTDHASALDERNVTKTALIVSVCAGLVTIEEESDIIRLVHYTTQEYLERTWNDWFPDAHSDITKACVTYLSFEVFDTGYSPTDSALMERLESNPLYCYAAKSWGYHVGKGFMEEEKQVLDFLQSTAKVSACNQAMLYDNYFRSGVETKMTGVHLAACFGLSNSISALLEIFHDINSQDSSGRTPLSWAAEKGYAAAVKLLLDKNADLKSKDNNYGWTPLIWAAEKGHEAVVKMLLDKNADIESQDQYGRTPLFCAAQNGHAAVVKLLLDKNIDVKSKDKNHDGKPIIWAAEKGHEAVVKLLVDKGADLESKDQDGRTPLSWAAAKELDGQGMQTPSDQHNCALHSDELPPQILEQRKMRHLMMARLEQYRMARTVAQLAVVELLVEKGADLQSKDHHGRTPQSWAAENTRRWEAAG